MVAEVSTDVAPASSPSCDSPGTVPISVYRKVCQERNLAVCKTGMLHVWQHVQPPKLSSLIFKETG